MHYVKEFNINGITTRQTACIELRGAPNAATEGYVGVLGIDVDSPTRDVYKCVAVNGSIYTWELLSGGGSCGKAVLTEAEMDEILNRATNYHVGSLYMYMGTTGKYTKGSFYVIREV